MKQSSTQFKVGDVVCLAASPTLSPHVKCYINERCVVKEVWSYNSGKQSIRVEYLDQFKDPTNPKIKYWMTDGFVYCPSSLKDITDINDLAAINRL